MNVGDKVKVISDNTFKDRTGVIVGIKTEEIFPVEVRLDHPLVGEITSYRCFGLYELVVI